MKGSTVYKDFLTNASVAWFTAGVITPLFMSSPNKKDFVNSLISVTMFILFLQLARAVERKRENDIRKCNLFISSNFRSNIDLYCN